MLALRAEGLKHVEIAARMGISAHTVKNHITSIHARALRILGWG